jgi:hypothetical protein
MEHGLFRVVHSTTPPHRRRSANGSHLAKKTAMVCGAWLDPRHAMASFNAGAAAAGTAAACDQWAVRTVRESTWAIFWRFLAFVGANPTTRMRC